MTKFEPLFSTPMLTVIDVAKYLNVSERTVRRYIAEGRLPAIRLKRQLRIHRTDVEKLFFGLNMGRSDDVR